MAATARRWNRERADSELTAGAGSSGDSVGGSPRWRPNRILPRPGLQYYLTANIMSTRFYVLVEGETFVYISLCFSHFGLISLHHSVRARHRNGDTCYSARASVMVSVKRSWKRMNNIAYRKQAVSWHRTSNTT